MQPIGILGALLGGYQQGRMLKQNREIKATQLARQIQEAADLKKYRADSLELQRKRMDQMEDPSDKARRDLFLTSLKGLGDDVDSAFDDLNKNKTDAEGYNAGAQAIYQRFNDRYQRLRAIHEATPALHKLGDFETVADFNVPNFIRAPKFDSTLIRRRPFDSEKFIKDTDNYIAKHITGAGIDDPAEQRALLDNWFNGQAQIHGKNVEDLWNISGNVKPNEIENGTTLGVSESGFIPTTQTDSSFPAFGVKTVNDNGNKVTYQHALPSNIATLPSLQNYLQSKNGIAPLVPNAQASTPQGVGPSPDQMADEFIVDDLHRMFTTPSISQKYGLTDPSNPEQFRKALSLYSNPDTYQALQLDLDRSVYYGNNGQGYLPSFPYGNPGDFGTSAKGQGLQGLIKNAPLMANAETLAPVPYQRRTAIPLSLKDRAAIANIRNVETRTKGQNFTNEILDAKAKVASATVYDQIRSADLKTLLSGMRLALEPLKFDLQQKRFDLDAWDKETDNIINQGRFGLAEFKAKVVDASTASRALLATAQKDLTSASMTLGSFIKNDLITSAVFSKNPDLQNKIQNNLPLTPEDLSKIESDTALSSSKNVKEAIARYKECQLKYKQAYAAVQSYASLASTFSNSSAFNTGVEHGRGTDNPLVGLGFESIGNGNTGQSNNTRPAIGGNTNQSQSGNVSGTSTTTTSENTHSATSPPPPTSHKPTSTSVIESARKSFANKAAKPKNNTGGKPTEAGSGESKPKVNPLSSFQFERK